MTALRRLLGARTYQILLAVLLFATLIYQKETGILPERQAPVKPDSGKNDEYPDGVRVTRVIDGDTFEIEGGERVRLIGIDTPETVKPNSLVECFGKESSDYLKQLIEGKSVRLEKDKTDRDRYARLLRYVYLGDQFINKDLVRDGYAKSVGYRPDVRHQEELDKAEQETRAAGRGRWAIGTCPQKGEQQ
ncbi:MAG: thermonuclease family protein [Candidatus Moraniibacteriota bacterium]